MIGIFAFWYAFLMITICTIVAIFLFKRLSKLTFGLRISLIIILLSIIGILTILGVAIINFRNLAGKSFTGKVKSPADEQCVDIEAVFDKEKVLILTKDKPIKLKGNVEVLANSSINVVLVDKIIDNQKEIRIIEPTNNVFLKLNIVNTDCPK